MIEKPHSAGYHARTTSNRLSPAGGGGNRHMGRRTFGWGGWSRGTAQTAPKRYTEAV